MCWGGSRVESSFNFLFYQFYYREIISLAFINDGKSVSNLCRKVSGSRQAGSVFRINSGGKI